MQKYKVKKLNNQGSTFVLALLVITLLTTLALALANATLGNMMMKSIDRGAKKTFYTAETLLDEIRVGVGYSSLDNLARAYETVLTTLIDTSTGSSSVLDNTEANKKLKETYVENVLKTVSGGLVTFGSDAYISTESLATVDLERVKTAATNYIQGYISGNGYSEDMAKVSSVGHIKAYKDANTGYKWTVILEDVAVAFKENKSGDTYFSNITADLEIEYPNMTVDFTSTNKLTDFTEFGLIADRSIVVSGQDLTVKSSVYAGNLIDIAPSTTNTSKGSSVLFVSEKLDTKTNEYINIDVVCGGDGNELSGTIRVGGNSQVQSLVEFKRSNIWCTNIATNRYFGEDTGKQDATAGATIIIDKDSYSYVKDDLSVDAQKSTVSIAGEYNGYKYDGKDNSLGHVASSAIIVNGKNSNVSITTKKLLLAGRAYIDVAAASKDGYMTGESLALKGDQEVYLIPAEFLGKNFSEQVTNPMSEDTWTDLYKKSNEAGSNVEICVVPDDYFAKSYINSGVPYRVVEGSNGMRYLYWNFANTSASAKFIKDIMDGKNADLKSQLERYTKNLLGGQGAGVNINLASGSVVNATGILMEAEGGKPGYTNPSTMPEGLFAQTSLDYEVRYEVLTHLLAALPWKLGGSPYYAYDAGTALEQLRGFSLSGNELIQANIIYNLIDVPLLSGSEYNTSGSYINYGPPNKNYTKMAIKGNYKVREDIHGGIIIATGDVELDHSFDGLIIAGGSITITGDATITTNSDMIQELILGKEEFIDKYGAIINRDPEKVPFKQYFYAFKVGALNKDSREEIKIENVDYRDLVNFNDWRKYEDK